MRRGARIGRGRGLGTLNAIAGSSARERSGGVGRRIAGAFHVAIALTGLAAFALAIAGALAPRYDVAMSPAAISSDGGHAFVFSPNLVPRWPYVVPSHPASSLAPGDVQLTEDGRPIGALDPAHADIRARGGGLYNLWEGALWFSTSDGSDPRTNGRAYRLAVQGRLAPRLAFVLRWSASALVALVLARSMLAVLPSTVRRWRRSWPWLRSLGRSAADRAVAAVAPRGKRVARWVPLTFRRTYALASAIVLCGFVWQSAARPAPLFTQSDSFGYIMPGLVWASGQDATGRSIRDLGYPLLTVAAVRLGSLATLPRIQLALVAVGIACLLGCLYLALSFGASRLKRVAAVPRSVSALVAAAAAICFVALLASHDLFVIDIESVMAEAPHLFPTALAALLFLAGFTAGSGRWSIVLLSSASLAAYGSAMVKPHSLLVVALCVATLAWKALRHRGDLSSPVVLISCSLAALLAAGLHHADAWITPAGADFGPKTLFCNRLDVIAPVFDATTPERRRIAALMRDVMADVGGWPLMGYSGDRCVYSASFTAGILAAAEADHVSPSRWEQREFLRGVLRNPVRYAADAWRQAVHFFRDPIVDADMSVHDDLSADGERMLAPYADLVNMPRQAWKADIVNWVPGAYPWLAGWAKSGLAEVGRLFAPVTLSATAAAAFVLALFGRRADCRIEVVVIATCCFTAAFIGTVLLSHSFDVSRYATDILPISLLWWFVGAAYLGHLLVMVAAIPFRRREAGCRLRCRSAALIDISLRSRYRLRIAESGPSRPLSPAGRITIGIDAKEDRLRR